MDQVGGAVISIAVVLTAVFVPTALVSGISGQFYRQFESTIAIATLDTPWDWLHLAYFYGYAISNYLTTPFLVRAAGLPVGGAGALAGGRPDLAPAQGDVPLL